MCFSKNALKDLLYQEPGLEAIRSWTADYSMIVEGKNRGLMVTDRKGRPEVG